MDLIEILLTYLKYNGKIYQYPKDEKTLFPYIFFIERNVDMMNKKETKEKICAFYASDYHFEMITLPYISKKLEENKNIVILTENNLKNTVDVLVSKINLKDEMKNKILSLNWENDDFNKFKIINKEIKNNEEILIFVKGKENYINNINKNIEKWTNNDVKSKVINCYDISEIGDNIKEITEKYNKILCTNGEKEIE